MKKYLIIILSPMFDKFIVQINNLDYMLIIIVKKFSLGWKHNLRFYKDF